MKGPHCLSGGPRVLLQGRPPPQPPTTTPAPRCTPLHSCQVATRRRAAGKREGTNPGETVPYVICVRIEPPGDAAAEAGPGGAGAAAAGGGGGAGQEQQQRAAGGRAPGKPKAAGGGGSGHIAERAFHPDELREDPTLAIDRE
jgi:hypothetical protein